MPRILCPSRRHHAPAMVRAFGQHEAICRLLSSSQRPAQPPASPRRAFGHNTQTSFHQYQSYRLDWLPPSTKISLWPLHFLHIFMRYDIIAISRYLLPHALFQTYAKTQKLSVEYQLWLTYHNVMERMRRHFVFHYAARNSADDARD